MPGATAAQAGTWAFDAADPGNRPLPERGSPALAGPGRERLRAWQLRLPAGPDRSEPDRDDDKAHMAATERRHHARRRRRRPPAAGVESCHPTMTKNNCRIGFSSRSPCCCSPLPSSPRTARACPLRRGATPAPSITFGEEDQGVLQIHYKGQFRMNYRTSARAPDDRTPRRTSASAAIASHSWAPGATSSASTSRASSPSPIRTAGVLGPNLRQRISSSSTPPCASASPTPSR